MQGKLTITSCKHVGKQNTFPTKIEMNDMYDATLC